MLLGNVSHVTPLNKVQTAFVENLLHFIFHTFKYMYAKEPKL